MKSTRNKKSDKKTATTGRWALSALVVIGLAQASCSQVSVMRGDIEGLTKVADQAERNSAASA